MVVVGMHVLAAESLWSRDKTAYNSIRRCYQCGRCTAACPQARAMEQPPARMVRLLQLGLVDDILNTGGIWRCVACGRCTAGCPELVDVPGMVGFLRRLWLQRRMPGFISLLAYLGVSHTPDPADGAANF